MTFFLGYQELQRFGPQLRTVLRGAVCGLATLLAMLAIAALYSLFNTRGVIVLPAIAALWAVRRGWIAWRRTKGLKDPPYGLLWWSGALLGCFLAAFLFLLIAALTLNAKS